MSDKKYPPLPAYPSYWDSSMPVDVSSGKVIVRMNLGGIPEAEAEVAEFMQHQGPIQFTPYNITAIRKHLETIFQKHLRMTLTLTDENGTPLE